MEIIDGGEFPASSHLENTMKNISSLHAMHDALVKLRANRGVWEYPDQGICKNCAALTMWSKFDQRLLESLMLGWKHHSGNVKFPVPMPYTGWLPTCIKSELAEMYFRGFTSHCLSGVYGKMRLELLDYMIANAEKTITAQQ